MEAMQLNIQQIFSLLVNSKDCPVQVPRKMARAGRMGTMGCKVWEVEDDYDSDSDIPIRRLEPDNVYSEL